MLKDSSKKGKLVTPMVSLDSSMELPKAPPPPSKAPQIPWGPWAAVVYAVVVYFAAQLLASSIMVLYPHARGWTKPVAEAWLNNSVVAQFFYVLLAESLTFGAIWWYVRRMGKGLRSIGWRHIRWIDVVYTLAGFAAYFVVYAVLFSLITHVFPSINVQQKQELGFQNVSTDSSLILTFFSLVILPPVVEETVFRGFVFSGLRTKLKPVVATILTSALFASAHLQFGSGQPLLWIAAIDTFTLSLVLCYLRVQTDSLWPGIMLHALKNGIAFTSLFLLHVR